MPDTTTTTEDALARLNRAYDLVFEMEQPLREIDELVELIGLAADAKRAPAISTGAEYACRVLGGVRKQWEQLHEVLAGREPPDPPAA